MAEKLTLWLDPPLKWGGWYEGRAHPDTGLLAYLRFIGPAVTALDELEAGARGLDHQAHLRRLLLSQERLARQLDDAVGQRDMARWNEMMEGWAAGPWSAVSHVYDKFLLLDASLLCQIEELYRIRGPVSPDDNFDC